jgi:hypothetical protein
MYEYKTLEGNHGPEIEAKIKPFADDGWRVVGYTAGGPVNFTVFVLLERQTKK